MKKTIVVLLGLVACTALGFADDDDLVKALMNGDRTVRKNATAQIKQLSKGDLIALAQSSIQSDALEPSAAIYAFHQILGVAEGKGFGVDDAVLLIKKPGSSECKLAVLDWINEFGIKGITSEDAAKQLPEIGGLFLSKQESMEFRSAAHKVARELAWKMHVGLKKQEKTDVDQCAEMEQILRDHVDRVCRVVTDNSETDEAVEGFAGYLPYYRFYAREGIYQDSDLRDAIQQACKQETRSQKTKKALQTMLSTQWNTEE